jgi:two-component system response regulator MprA
MAKILVIEDDDRLSLPYRITLTHQGHTIELASNGEEGLEKYTSFQPDLILLDLLMPKSTGLEFLEKLNLKGSKNPVKVIVFTNFSDGSMTKAAYDLGATNYIIKADTALSELVAIVDAALEPDS